MDKNLPALSPTTEVSNETSVTASEAEPSTTEMFSQILITLQEMNKSLAAMAFNHRQDRSEKEPSFASAHRGSSRDASVSDHRSGKAPMFTSPDRNAPPQGPGVLRLATAG
ncbi:unnamed protein product [Arabis nemorensis]|uniref:Uncharacterized protein n=1 Tax=Arabis nemorensis TaxID=586526 RepID=A0A565C8Y3_9BRAS|nr:unnamed protein product [Arabis nemorensis]